MIGTPSDGSSVPRQVRLRQVPARLASLCANLKLMGEAKRRKQLGLMPQSYTFKAELHRTPQGWQVEWQRAPEGVATAEAEAGLLRAIPSANGWPAEYRTRLLKAGRVSDFINSPDDLEAITVPDHLRVSGEWLTNFGAASLQDRDPESAQQFTLLEDKKAIRLRELDVSSDGKSRWEALPNPSNSPKSRQFLLQHPMARQRGELKESFQVTHHREGLVMIDPEPPAALLTALEGVTQTLNGQGEAWDEAHQRMLSRWAAEHGAAEDGQQPVGSPESRRLVLELRERAPLNAPGNAPLIEWGDDVVVLQPGSAAYSLDGHTWHSYFDPDAAPQEDQLNEFFQQILDVGTTEVTVYADGRVEWNDEEVAAEHRSRLREHLLERTGAGDADKWAEFARQSLITAYEDAAPYLSEVALANFPVPAALKLDVPMDAVEDPDHSTWLVFESQVSFDGETWVDVWLDDLPAELESLKP